MSAEPERQYTWIDHAGAINLFVRLAAELAILLGAALWGWRAADGSFQAVQSAFLGVTAALLAALAWALAWGMFIAPKARRRLRDPVRFIVEIGLFVLVAVALSAVGLRALGIVIAAVAALTSVLMLPFRQRGK